MAKDQPTKQEWIVTVKEIYDMEKLTFPLRFILIWYGYYKENKYLVL